MEPLIDARPAPSAVKTRRPTIALLVALFASVPAVFVATLPAAHARQFSGDGWGLVAGRRLHVPRKSVRSPRLTTPVSHSDHVGTGVLTGSLTGPVNAPPRAVNLTARGNAPHGARPQIAATDLARITTPENARVKRWGDRIEAPVRVWIASGDSVPGWRPAFATIVRQAFGTWEQIGLPVRFTFVARPEDAEVRVAWTERLAGRRAGVTRWTANEDGWLTQVNVVLATWASDGAPANDVSMRRIALHEIGHLLGLEHSADTNDVMAAWVRAVDLTARDRATVRLLYTLPPGEVADAGRLVQTFRGDRDAAPVRLPW